MHPIGNAAGSIVSLHAIAPSEACNMPDFGLLFPLRCHTPFETLTHAISYPKHPQVGATVCVERLAEAESTMRRFAECAMPCFFRAGRRTDYSGETIRLNLAPHQLSEAYGELSTDLFSTAAPFRMFTMLNPAQDNPDDRFGQGAQIVFYVDDGVDGTTVRQWLDRLSERLDRAGIGTGELSEGDTPLGRYASYNKGAGRGNGESTPFHQHLTQAGTPAVQENMVARGGIEPPTSAL